MRNRSHCRTAFTLIELTMALLLASLMMVGVMGITARLAKTNRLMHEQYGAPGWLEMFRHRLQSDYEGCRSIQVEPRRIRMRTYIVPQTSVRSVVRTAEIVHLPVEVTYAIEEMGKLSFVRRTERILFSGIPESRTSDIVAIGPTSFSATNRLVTDVAPPSTGIRVFEEDHRVLFTTALVRYAGAN